MTGDRDEAIDRLLRRSAAGVAGRDADPAAEACLDAETVAAWADGSLRGDALLQAQEHAADCARCQALMVTLAQTTPAPPVQESLWARWRLQWVVPAVAAATAIAIYVAVPGPRTASEMLTENEAEKSSARVAAPDEKAKQAPSQANPIDAFAPASRDQAASAGVTAEPSGGTTELKKDVGQAPQSNEARARQEADKAAEARRAAPATAAAAPPAPARADAVAAPAVTTFERSLGSAQAPLEVISPERANRWRVVAPGAIQSSTDSGVTYVSSRVEGTDVLTAGASPSASVCWFVGRGGVVFVTTDGRQWSRRLVPGGVDLIAVQPTDGRTASVTAAGGQTYRTTDGGQTWR